MKIADVPGCLNCTTLDQRGDRFRRRPCNAGCHAVNASSGPMPLTSFLCKLLTYKNADLLKADPKKAAKHYGIRADWAAEYIRLEKTQRGLAHG